MKTFKQFILESAPTDLDDFLQENCMPFFEELGIDYTDAFGFPLYRGLAEDGGQKIQMVVQDEVKTCLIKTARTNRQPRDTHSQLSDMADRLLKNRFAWKPRTESVFCYGEGGKSLSSDFGRLYQIVPIGEFRYVWSPDVRDFTNSMHRILKGSNMKKRAKHDPYSPKELEQIKPYIEDLVATYTDADLERAILGQAKEIMLGCKTYLAIPV
jgi:hypothetical protein